MATKIGHYYIPKHTKVHTNSHRKPQNQRLTSNFTHSGVKAAFNGDPNFVLV